VKWGVPAAFICGGLIGALIPFGPPHKILCPHWIAPGPGRLSFSFVLAEDVLHERYARGDEAYYRERNRASQAVLPPVPTSTMSSNLFPAIDNLAVGYDRLHQSAKGIPWLRAKLDIQMAAKTPLRDQYTTLANLGTLLIHQNLPGLMTGAPAAQAGVREGLKFIELSIQANPDAHFGREVWQAEAVRTLLRIHADPHLRDEIDILGYPWMEGSPQLKPACLDVGQWSQLAGPLFRKNERELDESERAKARILIPQVGNVPFDEPALGLLGMWWYGGGPNPHLALALAGIFERIGELPLAWVAYQRGLDLDEKFWPDPKVLDHFRQHCFHRQTEIEHVLRRSHREQYEAYAEKLKAGLVYQQKHQAFDSGISEPRTPISSDFIEVRSDAGWIWTFLGFGLLGAGIYRRFLERVEPGSR
jgi:hypothetical protein